MIGPLADLARAALFRIEPETAHRLALRTLATGLVPRCPVAKDPRLAVDVFGLSFPNPLGMAAGFDKDAEVPDALLRIGFGFAEVGSLTPRPQAGNARPRVFRLPDDRGLINRLGFNNAGHAAVLARLAARGAGGIVGVNVGANKDATDRAADYVAGIAAFAPYASYFTLNVSSPNTPGLRGLQERTPLIDLLARCLAARDATQRRSPLLLKVAPDLDDAAIESIAEIALSAGVDGLVVSNTTIARPPLHGPHAGEAGGLSGRPLFRRSTAVLARFHRALGGRLPLVGVGGVEDGATAFAKIAAGATLLQLYTGFVYAGPALVGSVLSGLSGELDRRGIASLPAAVGCEAERWSATDPDA